MRAGRPHALARETGPRTVSQEDAMSQDALKGEWKYLKGKIREWWGELTDDDVHRIGGNIDQLSGMLQKRYGYAKDKAMGEISRRIAEWNQSAEAKNRK